MKASGGGASVHLQADGDDVGQHDAETTHAWSLCFDDVDEIITQNEHRVSCMATASCS